MFLAKHDLFQKVFTVVDSIEGVNAPRLITLNILAVKHPPSSVTRCAASGKYMFFLAHKKLMAENEEQCIAHIKSKSKRQKVVAEEDSIGKVSVNEHFLQNVVQFAKGNRSWALTFGERMDILFCQAYLRVKHDRKQQKVGRVLNALEISQQVVKMFQRKHEMV